MVTISIADARAHLSEVIGRARHAKDRTVLASHGKPVAAIVPIEDFEILQHLEDASDIAYARRALRELTSGKVTTIPHTEVLRRMQKKRRRSSPSPR